MGHFNSDRTFQIMPLSGLVINLYASKLVTYCLLVCLWLLKKQLNWIAEFTALCITISKNENVSSNYIGSDFHSGKPCLKRKTMTLNIVHISFLSLWPTIYNVSIYMLLGWGGLHFCWQILVILQLVVVLNVTHVTLLGCVTRVIFLAIQELGSTTSFVGTTLGI